MLDDDEWYWMMLNDTEWYIMVLNDTKMIRNDTK